MTTHEWFQLALYVGLLLLAVPLLGTYMARVLSDDLPRGLKWLRPLERLIYRCCAINPDEEMTWPRYVWAVLLFHILGFVTLLAIQMGQGHLPLNPERFPGVPLALAVNTAVSFLTNTNWQAYSGEASLSYLTQAIGLAVHNFLSAATGIAVLLALIRGLTRKASPTIGNFWADLVRSTFYILIPLSVIWALLLVSQGVVQTWTPYTHATTLEGVEQVIPLGPAASQIAIKQLGTNGGGFFGVNSAHPFENPTPFSNFLEVLAILLIPAALTHTYGIMVGNRRHGRALLAAMLAMLLVGLAVALYAEFHFDGNMEGKEVRFGVMNSVLWATTTTAASNGSVNAMHDSLAPLSGLVTLGNMMVGEVIFGGVGSGLYGMIMFVVLSVFMAGLMVGRTPEYLGKKIEANEVIMAMIAVLAPCAIVLVFTAIGMASETARASISNGGPHGLSEILYAFTSMANNNGSAFGGLGCNTNFFNYMGSVAMLVGRFGVIVPVLVMAGRLGIKKQVAPSLGTMPTDGVTFVALLLSVIVIVGGLTFFPVLALGPVLEHMLLTTGITF